MREHRRKETAKEEDTCENMFGMPKCVENMMLDLGVKNLVCPQSAFNLVLIINGNLLHFLKKNMFMCIYVFFALSAVAHRSWGYLIC